MRYYIGNMLGNRLRSKGKMLRTHWKLKYFAKSESKSGLVDSRLIISMYAKSESKSGLMDSRLIICILPSLRADHIACKNMKMH